MLNKYITIIYTDKGIIVYLKKKIFLVQDYIIDKDYTLILVVLILSRYGLFNNNM